jgi:hypothetical protein
MPANKQNNPNFFGTLPTFTATQAGDTITTPVKTIGETQSTPAVPLNITKDDSAAAWAPTKPGVGAGTTDNAATSVNADNNPLPGGGGTTQILNVFNTSQNIVTQPNQLDQYASYTYNIGWYILSPQQYNAMVKAQKANVAGWQLLMQSGGAAITGRSPAFPVDYYMDDLEIESKLWGGGKNAANNAVSLRFRVTEPNGITLIQSLFNAVKAVYGSPQQAQQSSTVNTGASNNAAAAASSGNTTTDAPNYLLAQYCLVIEFYGYDSSGKLVAPAKGSYSTSGSTGQQSVITKYYPFRIDDIKFAVANKAIEYSITGKPIPMSYNSSTDRGTVPHDFVMTGQTVEQLLTGSKITVGTSTADPGARKTTPAPNQGIAPGVFVDPVQATGNINQGQADTLNLLAAGQLGA